MTPFTYPVGVKRVGAGGGFLPIKLLKGRGGIWPMGPSFADLCSMIKHLLRTLTQFLTGSFVFFLSGLCRFSVGSGSQACVLSYLPWSGNWKQ